MKILSLVEGGLKIGSGQNALELYAGQFCLLPASVPVEARTEVGCTLLVVCAGSGES